jgi:hypothetical protein
MTHFSNVDLSGAAVSNRPSMPAVDAHQGIHADVVFGSPKDNCRGSGICYVVADYSAPGVSRPGRCRRARAFFEPSTALDQVSMAFEYSDLCCRLMRDVFRKSHFTLSEPCVLPVVLSAFLGLSFREVSPGVYPIEGTPMGFRIVFSLC